ncbi:BTB domain-containing protein [Mycena sanguinolenta]|uniref:BTB domain-containing protein n=1 Tax=Mycena sanguinolenta TaxID=230812 RepID=A0A8H6Y358_9AGAR|nr:BTB domain-containing protein [Mycena sanguinolenta]
MSHPSIWYNDGSIIIQAENTQFRVHWTVLCKHSSFFRGFEDIPQPSDQPTIDGCPIVHLHGSAVDFQYVLEALYDPHFLGRTTLPLAAIGAMIRLGRKYNFKSLLASALERFISQAPTTLAEYDTIFSPVLAQENGILSALPFCHLHAARLDIASLVVDSSTNLDTLRRCLIGRERVLTKQFQPGYPLGWLIQCQGYQSSMRL